MSGGVVSDRGGLFVCVSCLFWFWAFRFLPTARRLYVCLCLESFQISRSQNHFNFRPLMLFVDQQREFYIRYMYCNIQVHGKECLNSQNPLAKPPAGKRKVDIIGNALQRQRFLLPQFYRVVSKICAVVTFVNR